jgi:Zinc-ribbon/Ring finger domain
MKDKDEPLDRYAVTEVMCMKCTALQPAEDRCNNPNCESYRKPFAKYFCRICHLYDDRSIPIFHCPYCNTCRLGLGLGIDFRHCMRCNACVSLADDDHRCIPQKLQGSCPICHEMMFSSTEPLRGLKCGHVMHLSCFTMYRRGTSYTCPLCQRSMEDMKDHFALLDAAVRMQPMPAAYLSTLSNIYCQDCGKTGQVQVRVGKRCNGCFATLSPHSLAYSCNSQYHFVGKKCPHCGSYNTREMARVQNSQAPAATAASPL